MNNKRNLLKFQNPVYYCMVEIENIIFDFGGVIYDIDHQKTKDAFADLGINNFVDRRDESNIYLSY